jgi:hypothetical protein
LRRSRPPGRVVDAVGDAVRTLADAVLLETDPIASADAWMAAVADLRDHIATDRSETLDPGAVRRWVEEPPLTAAPWQRLP